MTRIPAATSRMYRSMLSAQTELMRAFRGLWGGVAANRLESSWDAALDVAVARAEEAQAKAALLGTSYVAESLGELGDYVPPTAFPTAAPLVGVAPDGRSLRGLLETPRFHAVRALGNGLGVSEALTRRDRTDARRRYGASSRVDRRRRPPHGRLRPHAQPAVLLAMHDPRWAFLPLERRVSQAPEMRLRARPGDGEECSRRTG